MFEIVNDPRNYSWGSRTAIAELLGQTPSGEPEAELWFGDHPACSARIASTDEPLSTWGARHPERLGGDRLPFLIKILAADSPLSIQAHPTLHQAREGFARENALGVPVDAPNRNYRDANHKPEIIVALTEFSALCGFRPSESRDRIVAHLDSLHIPGTEALKLPLAESVEALLSRRFGTDALVDALASSDPSTALDDDVRDALVVATGLARHFPSDPGVALSLLLNHRTLSPGEALFLPAGNIHAYLRGVGVEVMAASDNVLRGGLTEKHIDVTELLAVLDFTELADPTLAPAVAGPVRTFTPGVSDFVVHDVTVIDLVPLQVVGPAIVVVTEGSIECRADATVPLSRGHAALVEAGETLVELAGKGRAFIATRPRN